MTSNRVAESLLSTGTAKKVSGFPTEATKDPRTLNPATTIILSPAKLTFIYFHGVSRHPNKALDSLNVALEYFSNIGSPIADSLISPTNFPFHKFIRKNFI
ncbi:unnamed protein product [Meganyctiphanes norvegica]|uniref:Uncharacterized protein n=1 Tax=Meganyctiphanes norvegica TaxID=48144 RepID=A0AAV2Q122_MEGNR